ncbi:N-acetylmuramoyl-L-alanine amidase [Clostridium sp. LIBA-8841]|uniref:N-acetylmuramoyl-L-alanine amidase n=1 Tax=Clostridium sp. LIBA-8841 TaxID=2987530 RepID=UPI002AC396E4|nr:N-acetylmuramoyl-L-alanine amidase [Clostridium sp. LIBA-8841]MDZ5254633.1 N-acetylmuramoyl-L-alanine amidase [Clostridium sp. LIBA-8841]
MIDVLLDPGHGGYDVGATGISGIKEKECTLYVCKACESILKSNNLSVKLTRRDDTYLTENERNKIAKSLNPKCFISVHFNSSNNLIESGTEVFYDGNSLSGKEIGQHIIECINKETELPIKGIESDKYKELEEIESVAILIKVCYLSNPKEEKLLKDYSFKEKIAQGLAKGILKYLEENNIIEVKSDVISGGYNMTDVKSNIINEPLEDKNQAKQWAKNKGATSKFIGLADLYWKLYKECGGVNPTVAYAQAALETEYGKFGGIVKEEFKNPCGLKTSISTDNSPDAHAKFDTWIKGVQAHLDHLALYAGASGYPKLNSVDPKHFQYLMGICKYVEDLGGKWVPSLDYGMKIIELINDISSTEIIDAFKESDIDKEDENNITSDKAILEVDKKFENINDVLKGLKEEFITIKGNSNNDKEYIDKISKENDLLKEENLNLKNKLEEYKKIIESIYDLVDSK